MSWLILIILVLLAYIKPNKNKNNNSISSNISIVIPAYNEENSIKNVVSIVKKISYVSEVIVVDDGSYDKTISRAKEAGATVISHTTNLGKGSAIETGFKHSKGDIIVFIDGDLQNLCKEQIDAMVKPVLEGKTDITKTKFKREHGRVTELTAKPLLNFFFPEIKLSQPLSGQFAGKRSALNKIRFEKDYGVDVGIILDADANGIKILEVDIGEVEHESSSLPDLQDMANEVTRTIVNRSMEYGRISLMDTVGTYIRSSVLGLSLITLGLFIIFFVASIPHELGVVIAIIGLVISIYYIIKLIKKVYHLFRKKGNKNFFRSFVMMHFPILISSLILILMVSTFIGAMRYSDGLLSCELTSGNLKINIFSNSNTTELTLKGPYKVDSALENESNIIRMPSDALSTLELQYNDSININNVYYNLNETRSDEKNTIRLPNSVRENLGLNIGEIVPDSRISKIFENKLVQRNIPRLNNSPELNNTNSIKANEYFIIKSQASEAKSIDIYFDNQLLSNEFGVFGNAIYSLYLNGYYINSFNGSNLNNNYITYSGNHIIELKVTNQNISSIKNFINSNDGSFLSFTI
jgi:glycosyltransferase involved in cell wall biosynthesis